MLGQTVVTWIDYFAVVVGVVMGAIFAAKQNLDIIGSITLAMLTGFGGGVLRDTLLHDQGFFFMEHPDLVILCTAVAGATFLCAHRLEHLDTPLLIADSLSVALFALAGTSKAWIAGAGPLYAVILGTITAVGGGALAAIAIAHVPRIFRSSNFYAIAGFAGSVAYCAGAALGAPELVSSFACVGVCLTVRAASLRFNLTTRAADQVPKE